MPAFTNSTGITFIDNATVAQTEAVSDMTAGGDRG